MPHIFFNKLEQRKSTQSLFPYFPSYNSPYGAQNAIAIYAAPAPSNSGYQSYNPYGSYTNNFFSMGYPYQGSYQSGYPASPYSNYSYPWSSGSGWSSPYASPWSLRPSYLQQPSYWQQPNWGWSSWSSPNSSYWPSSGWGGGYNPYPTSQYPTSQWMPSTPYSGSGSSSYTPGTLYGLVKRSNLKG